MKSLYSVSSFILVVFIFLFPVYGSPDGQCLKCICKIMTDCTLNSCESESCNRISPNNFKCACGPFALTQPYWMAARRPTLDNKTDSDVTKFKKCVESFSCSIRAVRFYLEKNAEDCNGDKMIDCDDYVLVHNFGAQACFHSTLDDMKLEKYRSCIGKTKLKSGSPKPEPEMNHTITKKDEAVSQKV